MKEIERKFLVTSVDFMKQATEKWVIKQGYLSKNPDSTVRVRTFNQSAFLTIKSRNKGLERHEFEYPIPVAEALFMLEQLCAHPLIEKTRYLVPFAGKIWEVDVFEGEQSGRILAEIELEHADEAVEMPEWAGKEVTGDPAYYNSNM